MRAAFMASLFAAAATAVAAAAAPNPDQADRFVRDLRAAVDAGPARIAAVADRRSQGAALQELESRSKRLFGNMPAFAPCIRAAGMLHTVWFDQVSITERAASPKEVALLTQAAIAAGVERHACSVAVDGLRPEIPPECLVVVDVANASAPLPARPAYCRQR